jgi:hypothetical protein
MFVVFTGVPNAGITIMRHKKIGINFDFCIGMSHPERRQLRPLGHGIDIAVARLTRSHYNEIENQYQKPDKTRTKMGSQFILI